MSRFGPFGVLGSKPSGKVTTSVTSTGLHIMRVRSRSGDSEMFTFGRYKDSSGNDHVLIKPGVVGKPGFTGAPGDRHDGHVHWTTESREGGPGYRDDIYGTGRRLGLRGRPWPTPPRSPWTTRALVRDTQAIADTVGHHATVLNDTLRRAESGEHSWADVATLSERLTADLRNLEESGARLGREAKELRMHATTRVQQDAINAAITAADRATNAAAAARVLAEEATRAARATGEAAARAVRVAAQAGMKAGRVAMEQTMKTARALAEAAARAARIALEEAARAARLAAELTAKAAVAVATAALSVFDR